MSDDRPLKVPPPWLFAISGIPYGVGGSFGALVMPYLAKKAGMDLDDIGIYGTLLLVPPMLQFLYAPIVDIGMGRRHWLILVSLLGALCFFSALQMDLTIHREREWFLALAVAGQLISGLSGSCNGGLMAQLMPDRLRGKASAALNVGNLSGGAIAGSLIILLIGEGYDTRLVGLVLVVMMMAPAMAILAVVEPARILGRTISQLFGGMFRDVGKVLFSRTGATGIALCLSPVGTAALTNYFTGMAPDYGASSWEIAITAGPASAFVNAVGALGGGILCDHWNRRAVYLLSGFLTAVCGLVMMVCPRTEMTYLVGGTMYALITGLCYAAFTATVLETIGKGGENASTQYALFVAAGNAAIAYVGLVDTQFSTNHGVEGVLGSDAVLNIAGVVVLGAVFAGLGYFKSLRHTPHVPPAPPDPPPPTAPIDLPQARVIDRD